jgi:GTP-binding protein
MLVSPPEVMTRVINGELCEPYENVSIESSPEYSNAIIEKMNNRKADYIDCVDLGEDK